MATSEQVALFEAYDDLSADYDALEREYGRSSAAADEQIERDLKHIGEELDSLYDTMRERGWLGDYQAWYMGMGE